MAQYIVVLDPRRETHDVGGGLIVEMVTADTFNEAVTIAFERNPVEANFDAYLSTDSYSGYVKAGGPHIEFTAKQGKS